MTKTFVPQAPNRLDAVKAVHDERPDLIRDPHRFTDAVARFLHATDPRWGRNGKRGDVDDLSDDAVAFKNPTSPAGGVEIIDIIAGAGGENPSPAWLDQTMATLKAGTVGAWVSPGTATVPDEDEDEVNVYRERLVREIREAVRAEMARVLEAAQVTSGQVIGVAEGLGLVLRTLNEQSARGEELAQQSEEWVKAIHARLDGLDKKAGCRLRW